MYISDIFDVVLCVRVRACARVVCVNNFDAAAWMW
jgi:hypothetical protein